MAGLNHRRPAFKVADAGGGERIRTIAEDLAVALAADRSPEKLETGPRCGSCGSRRKVTGELDPRCAECLAHDRAERMTRKAAAPSPALLPRRRSRMCPECHTELPVSGACGFCG